MNNKTLIGMKYILYLFGTLMVALPVQAASFDCAKAQSKVEQMICGNQQISQLDSKLGQDYRDVLSKANVEQKQLVIDEQKHWLEFTRNVCDKITCLKHAYWSRQAELENFFEPKSPLYKHESEKADAIKKVLATAPLYPSYDTQFCRAVFDDLKKMNGISFVDPVVQTQSYEDPALDALKRQCKGAPPLNFDYTCPPNLYPGNLDKLGAECSASYGLPPFKLFELKPSNSSEKMVYVFYSGDDYGPMNQSWNKPSLGGGYAAGFDRLGLPECKHYSSYTRPHGNARDGSNYDSVITYKNQYYLLNLYKENGSFWLSTELVSQANPRSICRWTPVKPNTLKKGK